MATVEQPPVASEVRFLPRADLYKEYGYTTPLAGREALEQKRFKRNFQRQERRDVRTYADEEDKPVALELPAIQVFKKENGSYVYEMRLSNTYTLLLSARPKSINIGSFFGNIDAFRVDHLLVARPDGQVTDAFAQYSRQVPNYLTFTRTDSAQATISLDGKGEYIATSFDVGIGSRHPHDLVYTLLHENAHVA